MSFLPHKTQDTNGFGECFNLSSSYPESFIRSFVSSVHIYFDLEKRREPLLIYNSLQGKSRFFRRKRAMSRTISIILTHHSPFDPLTLDIFAFSRNVASCSN